MNLKSKTIIYTKLLITMTKKVNLSRPIIDTPKRRRASVVVNRLALDNDDGPSSS